MSHAPGRLVRTPATRLLMDVQGDNGPSEIDIDPIAAHNFLDAGCDPNTGHATWHFGTDNDWNANLPDYCPDGYGLVTEFDSPTNVVPEPATLLLLGTGLLGMGLLGLLRRSA